MVSYVFVNSKGFPKGDVPAVTEPNMPVWTFDVSLSGNGNPKVGFDVGVETSSEVFMGLSLSLTGDSTVRCL